MTATVLQFPTTLEAPVVQSSERSRVLCVRVDNDVRPWPRHCECDHQVHSPLDMYGRTSRYRHTGSGAGHALGARQRDTEGVHWPADGTGPRVCWECHRAGHRTTS